MINHLFAHVIHSVWLVGRRTWNDIYNERYRTHAPTSQIWKQNFVWKPDPATCEVANTPPNAAYARSNYTHETRSNIRKHKKHSEQKRSWLDLSNTCDQGSSMRRLLLLWLCRCWLCSRQRSRGRSRLVSPSRVHLYLSGKCDGEGSGANPTAGVALEASLALQRKDYVPASFTSIRLPYISSLFLLVLKILY